MVWELIRDGETLEVFIKKPRLFELDGIIYHTLSSCKLLLEGEATREEGTYKLEETV